MRVSSRFMCSCTCQYVLASNKHWWLSHPVAEVNKVRECEVVCVARDLTGVTYKGYIHTHATSMYIIYHAAKARGLLSRTSHFAFHPSLHHLLDWYWCSPQGAVEAHSKHTHTCTCTHILTWLHISLCHYHCGRSCPRQRNSICWLCKPSKHSKQWKYSVSSLPKYISSCLQ